MPTIKTTCHFGRVKAFHFRVAASLKRNAMSLAESGEFHFCITQVETEVKPEDIAEDDEKDAELMRQLTLGSKDMEHESPVSPH